MALPNIDDVRFDIKIEAQATLKSLREVLRLTDDNKNKIIQFSAIVNQQSKAWGVSWQYALNVYKKLNAEVSKSGRGGTIFGNVGGQDLFAQSQQYLTSLQQAGRLTEKVGTASTQAGQQAQSGWQRAISTVNILRIALGALISMLLFQGIQAITSFFTTAIQQAREFEATLYRISNAERQLSMEGVEVSVKELKKGIDDIKNAFPIFSKEDIAELIGGIATTTKELGFTGQEILKLGAAVAILNINSTESETLLQTMGKVANSLVSPAAKSIGNLGLSFGKAKMEAKALELQILQTGESFDDLTEREKSQIKFEIVLETAGIEGVDDLEKLRDIIKEMGGDFAALDEYLESNDAKLAANSAAWKDLQTTVGQIILPFIPALTGFFKLIDDGFKGTKVVIIEAITLFSMLGAVIGALLTGQVEILTKLPEIAAKVREDLVNRFFQEVPEDAPQWFMKGWGHLIKEEAETATSGIDTFGEAVEDAFDSDEFGNKIEDILEDLENAREDLATKFEQKQGDIDLEYIRKQADAERDLARKVEDINRDAERDIANLKDKQREDDLRAEEDYQNKLWELRMRFLLNLEDALHARDARQVIRLQKEYEIDKEALERKKGMDDKQRDEDQSNALEDIEIKRQQRLEDAQREFQEKIADQRLAKQRELDDLNVWYKREEADLQEHMKRRAEELLKGWIEEGKITEANAAEVYAILSKYFGPGGMTDALASYMFTQLGQAAIMLGQIAGMMGQIGGVTAPRDVPRPISTGSTGKHSGGRGGRSGFAEGGTLLATRPTTVTFGEAGAEMATFTPLGRVGRNQGKIFGDGSGGGMNGQLAVELFLSPDLEARIIDASMDGVGEIITRVNRSKV